MFAVAGELLAKVSGMPWEDFVREKIQKRVGMTYSNTRCSLLGEGNQCRLASCPG